MHLYAVSSTKRSVALLWAALAMLALLVHGTAAATKIKHGPDPSVMKVGDMYYATDGGGGAVFVRRSATLLGLGKEGEFERKRIWQDAENWGDVWAPQIIQDTDGRTYIYFTAGKSSAHRMYVVSADTPYGSYGKVQKVNLPDDQWAIDGALVHFEGARWFVWSGWKDSSNSEQNLYICKMSSTTQSTGKRYIISQPRESSWEQADGSRINEAPEPIIDPNGQLHITYSANGSWGTKYCIADLRLRKGGDPTNVWDWYKSNGCLFGSYKERMMSGWDPTKDLDGPGHHSFSLVNGTVGSTGTNRIPFVFHAVPKGTKYEWSARDWYLGSYVWWSKTTYRRGGNNPGAKEDVGYSFKFFE